MQKFGKLKAIPLVGKLAQKRQAAVQQTFIKFWNIIRE